MACTTCPHPTCRHSFLRKGVAPCPECGAEGEAGKSGGGTLVLDPVSAPKWRLDCNMCNVVVYLPPDLHSAKSTKQRCPVSLGPGRRFSEHFAKPMRYWPASLRSCPMCCRSATLPSWSSTGRRAAARLMEIRRSTPGARSATQLSLTGALWFTARHLHASSVVVAVAAGVGAVAAGTSGTQRCHSTAFDVWNAVAGSCGLSDQDAATGDPPVALPLYACAPPVPCVPPAKLQGFS